MEYEIIKEINVIKNDEWYGHQIVTNKQTIEFCISNFKSCCEYFECSIKLPNNKKISDMIGCKLINLPNRKTPVYWGKCKKGGDNCGDCKFCNHTPLLYIDNMCGYCNYCINKDKPKRYGYDFSTSRRYEINEYGYWCETKQDEKNEFGYQCLNEEETTASIDINTEFGIINIECLVDRGYYYPHDIYAKWNNYYDEQEL